MMGEIEDNLKSDNYDKMHDVDRSLVHSEMEKYKLIKKAHEGLYTYLQKYIPEIRYSTKDGQIQSSRTGKILEGEKNTKYV